MAVVAVEPQRDPLVAARPPAHAVVAVDAADVAVLGVERLRARPTRWPASAERWQAGGRMPPSRSSRTSLAPASSAVVMRSAMAKGSCADAGAEELRDGVGVGVALAEAVPVVDRVVLLDVAAGVAGQGHELVDDGVRRGRDALVWGARWLTWRPSRARGLPRVWREDSPRGTPCVRSIGLWRSRLSSRAMGR